MIDILLIVTGAAALLIVLVALGMWFLRMRLDKRTRELTASQEKYRVLVENSSDGVLLIQDGRALSINRRAEEILGYTPEKLAQLKITEIFQEVEEDLVESSDAEKSLKRVHRQDGQDRWVRLASLPVEWENKPATMMVISDISERVQARDVIREAEKKFTDTLLAIPDPIIISTLEDGRIIEVNDAFEKMTGYSAGELSERTVMDINLWNQPEDREWLVEQLRLYGRVTDMEVKAQLKNGEIHYVLMSSRLIDIQGSPHILSFIHDVTEKKSTEERSRQQMQRLATLRVVDMTIAASMELDQVLNLLLEKVTKELNVDASVLLLLNSRQQLVHRASVGMPDDSVKDLAINLGEEHAGWAALHWKPVFVLNTPENPDNLLSRTDMAQAGFIAYYSTPLIAKGRVLGVLEIFNRQPLPSDPDWLNFFEALADQAAIAIDNASLLDTVEQANQELTAAYDDTIEGWAHALEMRDGETEGHSQRVLHMTLTVARMMGFSENDLVHIKRGALLHDIGKMAVPDAILFKPGPLTADEWEIMRKHPHHAYDLLSGIAFLRAALDIPYCHHERWNGSGYPRGLAGDSIPLAARIFAVVDVWDALLSDRPYRNAWDEVRAIDYIRENSGILFDPAVINAFLEQVNALGSPDKFRQAGSGRQSID